MASSITNEQQLLNDVRELFTNSFKCTIQDLRNPTEEFVTEFYLNWLQEFGADVGNIMQVQFAQQPIICNHVDAYSSVIPKVNLLKCIRSFDVVHDFGLLDLVSPTPKRTQNNMRAFLNFFRYADHRVQILIEKQAAVEDKKNEIKIKSREKEELKEKLNSVTMEIAQIQTTKSQVQEELESLERNVSQIKLQKELMKTKTEEANHTLKEVENTLQKIERDETLISNKIKESSSNVVDSPTSIVTELEELRKKSEQVEELSKQKRDVIESKMQTSNKLKQLITNLQRREVELKEILKQIDQQRDINKKIFSDEKKVNQAQEKLNELKSHLMSLITKKSNQQESLQSLYLRWKAIKPELLKSLEAAKIELKNVKKEQKNMESKLRESADVQKQVESLTENIIKNIAHFKSDFKMMQTMIDNEINKAKGEARATINKRVNNVKKVLKK